MNTNLRVNIAIFVSMPGRIDHFFDAVVEWFGIIVRKLVKGDSILVSRHWIRANVTFTYSAASNIWLRLVHSCVKISAKREFMCVIVSLTVSTTQVGDWIKSIKV